MTAIDMRKVTRLGLREAMALLQSEVDKVGVDYTTPLVANSYGVNARCLYVYEDCPHCLVGRVLHAAGWTLDDLLDAEGYQPTNIESHFSFQARLTGPTRSMLTAAQNAQDIGLKWGHVLRSAVEAAAQYGWPDNLGLEDR